MKYTAPPRASKHCRHYSFVLPIDAPDSGPCCAIGHDLYVPRATLPCMPDPTGMCLDRAEYTDEERAAWKQWTRERADRQVAAIRALPSPTPVNTSGRVTCPNCGGSLYYSRWHRGAEIACDTDGCCGARYSIASGADWPVFKKG